MTFIAQSFLTGLFLLYAIFSGTPKPFTIVASGDFSPERHKLLMVSFNKYYNLDMQPATFRTEHHLNSIDYKKQMTIQLYMGEHFGTGHQLTLDALNETETEIEIRYSFHLTESIDSTRTTRPFIIAATAKDRKKQIVFFENGIQQGPVGDVYIKH